MQELGPPAQRLHVCWQVLLQVLQAAYRWVCAFKRSFYLCIGLLYGSCGCRVAILDGGLRRGRGGGCGRRGRLGGQLKVAEDIVEDEIALLLDCQEEGLHEAALVLSLQARSNMSRLGPST